MSVDDDTLRNELDRLVQPVDDVDGIVAEVERRRTRAHRRRTAVRLVAAASVLVLVGVAGVALATRDGDREVVTAGPAPTEQAPPGPTAPAGPSVTVTTTDLGPLHVTASELVPSENAWLEHTITIQNTSVETVYVDDHRTGGFLGPPAEPRQLVVGDEGCGYASGGPDEPVMAPACQYDLRNLTIEPGAAVTSRVVLWRDLAGLRPVTSETFEFRKPIRHDTRGFVDPERRPVEGEIVLTYEGLADPTSAGGENAAPPSSIAPSEPGASAHPVAPTNVPTDAAPPPFFDPPEGFEGGSSRIFPHGGPTIFYSFMLESFVVEGAIGQALNVSAKPVPSELGQVRDPVAFTEQWMDEVSVEEIGGRRVAVARSESSLTHDEDGLSDRVQYNYLVLVGDAVVEIVTLDVDRSVVATLIASIDEDALTRALAAAG